MCLTFNQRIRQLSELQSRYYLAGATHHVCLQHAGGLDVGLIMVYVGQHVDSKRELARFDRFSSRLAESILITTLPRSHDLLAPTTSIDASSSRGNISDKPKLWNCGVRTTLPVPIRRSNVQRDSTKWAIVFQTLTASEKSKSKALDQGTMQANKSWLIVHTGRRSIVLYTKSSDHSRAQRQA